MTLPILKQVREIQKIQKYDKYLLGRLLYEYLFVGSSHRRLDQDVLGFDSKQSKGFESMSLLHHYGIHNEHGLLFKESSLFQALSILDESLEDDYHVISKLIKDFLAQELPLFIHTTNPMMKKVGKAQYNDGIRVEQDFFKDFNDPDDTTYCKRGMKRPVYIFFNGKIFCGEYRYENQNDETVNLHRIEFFKALKEEFKNKFPSVSGSFLVYKGKDQSHFVIESEVSDSFENTMELSKKYFDTLISSKQIGFNLKRFHHDLTESNLLFSYNFLKRFICALLSKPFVLLTGLTGSGKTQIALALAFWLSPDDSHYAFIPVGADWTNREPLLGYPDALNSKNYVKPDGGVLDVLLAATKNPDTPYFIILDEMNLSHVERYFADFLSIMESRDMPIPLHSSAEPLIGQDGMEICSKIFLPRNVFIIGTVNIDETTYMFSPKVLDRAGVIEFRVNNDDMQKLLMNPQKPNLFLLKNKGSMMMVDFVKMSKSTITDFVDREKTSTELLKFFDVLRKIGFEFGFRTASEIFQYIEKIRVLEGPVSFDEKLSFDDAFDSAIIQKLLPKIHGSRKRILPLLERLAQLCVSTPEGFNLASVDRTLNGNNPQIKYQLSFDKISRMYDRAIQDGFTSFAEA